MNSNVCTTDGEQALTGYLRQVAGQLETWRQSGALTAHHDRRSLFAHRVKN